MDLKPTLSSLAPFAQYEPPAHRYDEYRAQDGTVRAAWRMVAEHLDGLGDTGIQACAADAARLVHESGATFRVVSDDGDQTRPWQLSTVPLVLDAGTWSSLESGLQQRVRLLDAVLADLLGPQRLLKERILPPELLSANPYFARAYHGLRGAGSLRLNVTATDLARANDGAWWVTGDRTRAPSGLGYLLENRIITSRVLPRLIRQSNVTRLASFFSSLRNHLNSLAPRMRDNPRVAILTPGQKSYRYFEDTYLARYLGYTLVQGRDLAVRGNRLNLKTLGGLLPIEVLWRHISDHNCDPLELDPGSTEGVTGLLQTIRGGAVAVANGIGSMLVQMPALLPFLPAASRLLFSESLSLPTIATYWCGGEKERAFVLSHLDELLLRPAFAVSGAPPTSPAQLSSAARAELIAAVNARPYDYVAQQRPARSTTPVWHDGQLQPWHVALRSFHVQSANGVEVLPGGLVRVSPEEDTLDRSPTSGQLGQDCWVVGDAPVDTETTLLAPPNTPIQLTRSGAELPSRVAEHLFWLGRYVERTEAIARLLRTTLTRLSGENDLDEVPELSRLTAALAAIGQIEPDYAIAELVGSLPALEHVLPDSIFDRTKPRGLQAGVRRMMDNAAAVRDRLSLDAYRIISRIGDELVDPGAASRGDIGATIERINRLITDLLAFSGLANESMTRTHGWRFLQLGYRIERGYQTSELLAATLVHRIDDERPLLESVLRATDSLMTYRSRYLLQLQPAAAIDLLITDDTNPRSISFQVENIRRLIGELPTDASDVTLGEDERLAESLLHRVRMSDSAALSDVDDAGYRERLDVLLGELIKQLPRLSDTVSARYLIHTATTQVLTGRNDGPTPET